MPATTRLAYAAPVFAATIVHAQCAEEWVKHSGEASLGNAVYAMEPWDPDGPGPHAEFLVFGGPFISAGGAPASHIVAWNGQDWSTLGAGVSDSVYALETFGADLIAGGYFTSAGGGLPCANIARWDGAAWHAMGSGIPGFVGNLAIADLDVYSGELIAAGRFESAGGVPCQNIARWNGAAWQSLGSGLPGGNVRSLAVAGNDLIAGTTFSPFSIAGCGSACQYIARWDGVSWQSLGTGLQPYATVAGGGLMDLAVLDGRVVAVGSFGQGGGFWAHAAVFDGAAWSPLAALPLPEGYLAGHAHVHSARLYVSAETDVWEAQPILRWSGQAWEFLPATPAGVIFGLTSFRTKLVAAGVFPPTGGFLNEWAEFGCACYADCNNAGGLTVADFGCFQTQFVAGHPYADCNSDNALTVADFGCFQTKFVAGCP
jgi:trimeric autotransporter adhesin